MSNLSEKDFRKWIGKYWLYLLIRGGRKTRDEMMSSTSLADRMNRLAKLCSTYIERLTVEYGVRIDIIECWEEILRDYQVNILYERESEVIKYMILHAKWQGEKFSDAIKATELELKDIIESERQSNDVKVNTAIDSVSDQGDQLSYESLFSNSKDKAIVSKALIDLGFTDGTGKCHLGIRQKGKIAGLIEALIKHELIIDHPYGTIGTIFFKKLGLDNTRLKKDSKQSDDMAKRADKYFKYTLGNH